MPSSASDSHIDLEKELTCSICTGILYQPLTLLDCLHTFCGACLKEWFAFQASTATSLHPYTCPSCRASVRDTRPNASYNTLLGLFLNANPAKGKTEQEKAEDREKYRAGSNVLPRLRPRRQISEGGRERSQVEEARVQSLRDAGIASSHLASSLQDGSQHVQYHDGRNGSPRSQSASRDARILSLSQPVSSQQARERQVEHQASIRSLLSTSDVDSEEMADRIMRQIADEGLLEGVDLESIDVDQEDALSERIAQAYRRRMDESRRRRTATSGAQPSSRISAPEPRPWPSSERDPRPVENTSADAPLSTEPLPNSADPPSIPMLEAQGTADEERHAELAHTASPRASANLESPQTVPIVQQLRTDAASAALHPRVQSGGNRGRGISHGSGLLVNPTRNRLRSLSQSESITDPVGLPSDLSLRTTGAITTGRQRLPASRSPRHNAATFPMTSEPAFNRSTPSLISHVPSVLLPSSHGNRPSSSSSTSTAALSSVAPTFEEPQIICDRCGEVGIQYDLHYNCHSCRQGKFNLCLRCYRTGRGCLNWYGFGSRASHGYAAAAPPGGYSPGHEGPHTLIGHRFRRPPNAAIQISDRASNRKIMTTDDPASRLEAGAFCDVCSTFANACYWKCNTCNDGDWGFCNRCVNQGRHCTHPLLPLMHQRTVRQRGNGKEGESSAAKTDLASTPPLSPSLTPRTASIVRSPTSVVIAGCLFKPLTFSTDCDICRYPIPPSRTRFHCPNCNEGDYDICSSCYLSLVPRGAINPEDGHQGWRRCFKGHRMIVVGFEDRDGGQWRKVVNDLVGGHALNEDEVFRDDLAPVASPSMLEDSEQDQGQDSFYRHHDGSVRRRMKKEQMSQRVPAQPKKFPPDGGEGFRLQARWSYFPADGVTDELSFPRGAEITEAEDINGDWYAGVYCGKLGLLPSGYVVIRGSN